MDAVWGEEYMDNFNRWTVRWANAYEETGRKLPRFTRSGNRTSGMRHFLGHITAYAGGRVPLHVLQERFQARLQNGWLYAQGLKREEFNFLPEGKKLPGSIPPFYVISAWEVIKSGELNDSVAKVILPPQLANKL
jgi:hypothetical protein